MSELKEFLENKQHEVIWCETHEVAINADNEDDHDNCKISYERVINIIKLGLFFWERGGKEYCNHFGNKVFESIELEAYQDIDEADIPDCLEARDFLDCLACLGEERVKELIKELEKGEK